MFANWFKKSANKEITYHTTTPDSAMAHRSYKKPQISSS